jgi:hypothetical protein
MLALKGKLKRLDGGMPRYAFWEMVDKRRNERGWHAANSNSYLRSIIAAVFRVRPEYEAEVGAYVQMLCESTAIIPADMVVSLDVFSMKALRVYMHGYVKLAVETDRGWLVFPKSFRTLNRQLTKEKHHD